MIPFEHASHYLPDMLGVWRRSFESCRNLPLGVARLGLTLGGGLLLLGCMGELGGRAPEESSGSEGLSGIDPQKGPLAQTAGATEIRRLGKIELRNSVRALLPGLSGDFDPAADVPNDNDVELAFSVPGTVSEIEVKRFADLAAESISLLGAGSPGASFVCTSDETTCAREFAVEFSGKAFRRPALTEEIDDLMALFTGLNDNPEIQFTFVERLDAVAEAILQSPGFLYRWELGPQDPKLDGELVKYDAYEMASRLSYFLWNSPPDELLLTAAREHALGTPDEVTAQTARMMLDPRFDEALADFTTQWLEITELPHIVKDTGVYPNFSPALASAMFEEAQTFSRDVFRSDEPTLSHLLSRTATRVSPELAAYYGVGLDAEGVADLASTPRRGILMQGAVMAAKGNSYRTSPVRRGKFILNRLLCMNVPPPPPDAALDLPPPDPSLTLREQMALHASAASCKNCHSTMDPLGFAFEHFDGAGAYREQDGALPIDSSGELSVAGEEWAFEDADELLSYLSNSPEVRECFSMQWVRYALDRFEHKIERGSVDAILAAQDANQLSLPDLITAITQSKPFSHRALREGETGSL